MNLRINFSPKLPTPQTPKLKLKPHSPITLLGSRVKPLTKCSSEPHTTIGESDLAQYLAQELAKRNTLLVQRHEAMEKSRDILFRELCSYLSMETHEVKTKWKNMDEDDKWVLVRGFVSNWAVNFHPLSVKSVKELVDEETLAHENNGDSESSSGSALFSYLKKLLGSEQNDTEV